MRDFEYDVIRAAIAGHPLPVTDFSWSAGRDKLFRFCKRAYFIRYHLAQGGWNRYAHTLVRYAYFEKHLPDRDLFLSSRFERAVAEAVRDVRHLHLAPEKIREEFARSLMRHLEAAMRRLRNGLENQQYFTDPKLPGLLEAYHYEEGYRDPGGIIRSLAPQFGAAYMELLKSGFTRLPEKLLPGDWRLDEEFLRFPWHDTFPVWLHGGIRTMQPGTAVMYHFNADSETELPDLLIQAALWRHYAGTVFHGRKAAFYVFQMTGGNMGLSPDLLADPATEQVPLADLIDAGSAGMLALTRPDGCVAMADFPPEPMLPDSCSKCRFRRTCRGILDAVRNGRI